MRAERLLPLGLLVAVLAAPTGAVAQPADPPVRVLHLTLDSLHPSEVGPQTPTLTALQASGTCTSRRVA